MPPLNRKKWCRVQYLLVLACLFASLSVASAHRLLLYYQSAPGVFNASNIDFAHLTHLCHTPIVGFDNGTLHVASDFVEPDLIRLAHARGVKVLVTVGAYSQRLWANSTATAMFAKEVARFVLAHGYDGVDADWEVPSDALEARQYAQLFVLLRQMLGASKLLSCAVTAMPNVPGGFGWFDFETMTPLLDFYNGA